MGLSQFCLWPWKASFKWHGPQNQPQEKLILCLCPRFTITTKSQQTHSPGALLLPLSHQSHATSDGWGTTSSLPVWSCSFLVLSIFQVFAHGCGVFMLCFGNGRGWKAHSFGWMIKFPTRSEWKGFFLPRGRGVSHLVDLRPPSCLVVPLGIKAAGDKEVVG